MPELAGPVGQWIGWIGHDEHERIRRGLMDTRHNILVDTDIRIEQSQPARRIIAIGRAASLLVDAGGDHDERRAREIRIIAVAYVNTGR